MYKNLSAVYKFTGCAKVYRLYRFVIQVYRPYKSLPAVKSTGCTDLSYKFTGRSQVYQLHRLATQSTGCTKVYRLYTSLPAVHKSTGCTKVYRPFTSLPAVQTYYQQKSIGCADSPPTKVYQLHRPATQVYRPYKSLPAVHKSTGRSQVYQLHRLATQVYLLYKSLPAVQFCHKSTAGPGRSFSGCLRLVNSL